MEIDENVIERWFIEDNFIKGYASCLGDLKKGKKLKFKRNEVGYIDLRGIRLNEFSNKEKDVEKVVTVKSNHFYKVDFSRAELSNTFWNNCTFIECKFEKATFYNVSFKNCVFEDLIFLNCNFKHCYLALNSRINSGIFKNVDFLNCTLKYVNFCFPIISHCKFSDCKIDKVNFDGSRFRNTAFAGEIESADFSGYSQTANTKYLGLFTTFDPKSYKNSMANVEFSNTVMKYVGFHHEVDLSNCKFHLDEDHILIKNPFHCYSKVKEVVNTKWNTKHKEYANHILDLLFLGKDKEKMKFDFQNKVTYAKSPIGFDDNFFELIKSVNKESV